MVTKEHSRLKQGTINLELKKLYKLASFLIVPIKSSNFRVNYTTTTIKNHVYRIDPSPPDSWAGPIRTVFRRWCRKSFPGSRRHRSGRWTKNPEINWDLFSFPGTRLDLFQELKLIRSKNDLDILAILGVLGYYIKKCPNFAIKLILGNLGNFFKRVTI